MKAIIVYYIFFKCWGDFVWGRFWSGGDFDKCGGDIDGGEFAVGRIDQVPFLDKVRFFFPYGYL
jgi:hypothetical protein